MLLMMIFRKVMMTIIKVMKMLKTVILTVSVARLEIMMATSLRSRRPSAKQLSPSSATCAHSNGCRAKWSLGVVALILVPGGCMEPWKWFNQHCILQQWRLVLMVPGANQ